ncbi:MARVEL domain-containing protein [Pleurotus pulmonarius]
MNGFATPRLVVLGLITVLALAVLGIDVHYTYILNRIKGLTVIEGLGIACALLTAASMPAILFFPRGSFPTTVLFETMWLSILWVLWLLTAAVASSTRVSFMKPLGSRGCSQLEGELFSLCVELPAIEGLAYATWILMMSYCLALYTLSYKAMTGGHPNIWSASASQLPYSKRYYIDLTSDGTMESHKPAV